MVCDHQHQRELPHGASFYRCRHQYRRGSPGACRVRRVGITEAAEPSACSRHLLRRHVYDLRCADPKMGEDNQVSRRGLYLDVRYRQRRTAVRRHLSWRKTGRSGFEDRCGRGSGGAVQGAREPVSALHVRASGWAYLLPLRLHQSRDHDLRPGHEGVHARPVCRT